MRNPSQHKAFTLIELSIVLVIIGLIVGGVLVGRDLIASSQLRAQVTQFERFNTAVGTFVSKYNCLPGDCATALTYFPSLHPSHANGNGNGTLDDLDGTWAANTTGNPMALEFEPTLYWNHLLLAGLTECCKPEPSGSMSNYIIGRNFPSDKLNGYGITVNAMNGQSGYFWGVNLSATTCCPNGVNPFAYVNLVTGNATGVISAPQAKAFDMKIDDGFPTTGNIYTANLYGGVGSVRTQSNAACIATGATPQTYLATSNATVCSLWINIK